METGLKLHIWTMALTEWEALDVYSDSLEEFAVQFSDLPRSSVSSIEVRMLLRTIGFQTVLARSTAEKPHFELFVNIRLICIFNKTVVSLAGFRFQTKKKPSPSEQI